MSSTPAISHYLKDACNWAYISPACVSLLDREIIVWAILWGNRKRLMQRAFNEIKSGWKVRFGASTAPFTNLK